LRAYERQFGETAKAYDAFALYRDMGSSRSTERVAKELGKSWGLIQRWCTRHDWVERVRAYEDWLEMVGRGAVEDHERTHAENHARRREDLRRLNLENEERAARQTGRILDELERMPLVRTRVTRENEDGRPVEYVKESAVGPLDLAVVRLHRIAKASEPTKVAPTDPTGEHEHGRSAEDIDREFEEAFGSERFEEEEQGDE
jgi:hypothetical protein